MERKELRREWISNRRYFALLDEPIRIYFDYQEYAYPDEWQGIIDEAIELFEDGSNTISTIWKDGVCEILDFNVYGLNLILRRKAEPIDSFIGDSIWSL